MTRLVHLFAVMFPVLAALICAAPATAQPLPAGVDPQNAILIDTKYGRIVIKLRPDLAPKHVERIKTLARDKFYDNVPFHRVIAGFMAQTGDGQNGDGTGGSKYPNLPAEFTKRRSSAVSSAWRVPRIRTRRTVSSSSCSATVVPQRPVHRGGEVVSGMEVVDKLKKGAAQSGAVTDPDRMLKVQVGADAK